MDARQIHRLLRQDPYTRDVMRGVYARDELPVTLSWHKGDGPRAYIINWDEAHLPGSHWVALYLHPTQGGEYFDSYGLPPIAECQKLLDMCRQSSYNVTQLQEDTLVCGQYCVLYLMMRCRGRSLFNIIRSLQRPDNDGLVHAFVRQFYPQLPFKFT